MTRPRLLDLFCGAGGCSVGYHRAGFDVTGVDIHPQPHYPYEFVQADAMTFPLDGYDVIHASPPCQGYAGVTAWRGNRDDHPRLISDVRMRLTRVAVPYVIENVPDARRHLRTPVLLCGSQFGLAVRRHRYFELWPGPAVLLPGCQHRAGDYAFDHGGKQTEAAYREAMGCGWMTVQESREAIPPAYAEYVGAQLFDLMALARR